MLYQSGNTHRFIRNIRLNRVIAMLLMHLFTEYQSRSLYLGRMGYVGVNLNKMKESEVCILYSAEYGLYSAEYGPYSAE